MVAHLPQVLQKTRTSPWHEAIMRLWPEAPLANLARRGMPPEGQERFLNKSLDLSSMHALAQEVHCHLPMPKAQECLTALGSVGPLVLLLGIAPGAGVGLSAFGSFGQSCQMFATSLAK